jgi:hypothetical protein
MRIFSGILVFLLVCSVCFGQGVSNVTHNVVQKAGTEYTFEAGSALTVASGVTVDLPAGAVARADLVEDALATFPLPFLQWTRGTFDDVMVGAATGKLAIGEVGTGVFGLLGTAANASTEATSSYYRFTLPENYVAAGDVTFVVTAKCTGAPETKTVDAVIKEISPTAGTVGSDICATAIQTITSSFVAYSFTVTATGLVAGDVLQIQLNTNVIIAAGTDAIFQLSNAVVKCDVKG